MGEGGVLENPLPAAQNFEKKAHIRKNTNQGEQRFRKKKVQEAQIQGTWLVQQRDSRCLGGETIPPGKRREGVEAWGKESTQGRENGSG